MNIENKSQVEAEKEILNENISKNIENLNEENLSEFDENLIFEIKNLSEKNLLTDDKIKFYGNLFDFNELGEKIFPNYEFNSENFINAKNSFLDSVDFALDFEDFYGEGEDLKYYEIGNFIFNYKEKNKINPEKKFYNEEDFEDFLEENNFQEDIQDFNNYLEKFLKNNNFVKKFIKNIYKKIKRV